jgi:molybdenum cofactor synthesis domain-containing protein
MKIAILGIGTELTDGQILNRNGQWLSQRMYELGVRTSSHVVVPDETPLILRALDFASGQADLIFVTGGLGPTSDDFTRDVISAWTQKKLIFHEASWIHVETQLKSRGLQIKDMHKQECFFPETSKVFQNNNGTANAFSIQHQGKWIFVLPGPPKEIETLWKDFLHKELAEICQGIDAQKTWSWDCIGLAEADLAAKIEKDLPGCPLQKGYRVHLPYVEFKLFYKQSEQSSMQKWRDRVEVILGPWIISRNGQDAAQELVQKLKSSEASSKGVWICDELTQSFLIQRFLSAGQTLLQTHPFLFNQKMPNSAPEGNGLRLYPSEEVLKAKIELYSAGSVRKVEVQAPDRFASWPERQKQFFSEMALVQWLKHIQ